MRATLAHMAWLYSSRRAEVGVDIRVGRLAARQHGVFTRAQALDLGTQRSEIRWRLETGRWVRVFPAVYLLAGSPETWVQRAMAACLHWGSGAAISHRAAAKLRSLCGIRHARIELSVVRNRNRQPSSWVLVHRLSAPIPVEDVTTIDGLPVTKPARMLLELAATESEHMTARFLDDALRRGLVSFLYLERWLTDPRRRHQRGARTLHGLMQEGRGHGVVESWLEGGAMALLKAADLPMPILQHRVDEGGRIIGRLDFAYPEQRVGIELDGFRFHDTRDRFDAERARGNQLQALGWKILRVTSKHLEQSPDEVIAWIRRAIGA